MTIQDELNEGEVNVSTTKKLLSYLASIKQIPEGTTLKIVVGNAEKSYTIPAGKILRHVTFTFSGELV